jgi:predicted nucleotidyltransferase
MAEDSRDEPAIQSVDVDGMSRYLERCDVVFAMLFGSRARETARESSDVDVALQFPAGMTPKERFRRRNRIDAELQEYADGFVDVSDIEELPLPVARAALRDGFRLVGDGRWIDTHRERIEAEYEASASERERERREFIDRLARGEL